MNVRNSVQCLNKMDTRQYIDTAQDEKIKLLMTIRIAFKWLQFDTFKCPMQDSYPESREYLLHSLYSCLSVHLSIYPHICAANSPPPSLPLSLPPSLGNAQHCSSSARTPHLAAYDQHYIHTCCHCPRVRYIFGLHITLSDPISPTLFINNSKSHR